MIPPILDFDKDPVIGFHKKDILCNKYSKCGVIQFDENNNQKNDKIYEIEYDGINDDIYEDDDNGYEERMIQNKIDENENENENKIDENHNQNEYKNENENKNNIIDYSSDNKETILDKNSSNNNQEDSLWFRKASQSFSATIL